MSLVRQPKERVESYPSRFELLVVWALEIAAEAIGSGFVLSAIGVLGVWHDPSPRTDSLANAFFLVWFVSIPSILLVFCVSGYVVTTGLCRLFWKNRGPALAAVCAGLYIAHAEICFAYYFRPPAEWPLRLVEAPVGGLITFGCVSMGNLVLRRRRSG
jgi:hypothetical protein